MESILAKSVKDQYEIGSRVATLLAGTSLTTTAGVDIKRRDPVEEIGYETVGRLNEISFYKNFNVTTYSKVGLYPLMYLHNFETIIRWTRQANKKKS